MIRKWLDSIGRTVISSIDSKTDNLPDNPADETEIEAAITAAYSATDDKIDSAQGDITSILEDTSTTIPVALSAINTKTTNLPADPASGSSVSSAITAAHSATDGKVDSLKKSNAIFVDLDSGTDSTTWPYGYFAQTPCKTEANVLALMAATGITIVNVLSKNVGLTLSSGYDFVTLISAILQETIIDLNSKLFSYASFIDCSVYGDMDDSGYVVFTRCALFSVDGFSGLAIDCSIDGDITGITYAVMHNCNVTYPGTTLSLKSGEPCELYIQGIRGDLILTNVNHANSVVDISANGARIDVSDASLTNGTINIRGSARVIGVGNGATINDDTIESQLDAIQALVTP